MKVNKVGNSEQYIDLNPEIRVKRNVCSVYALCEMYKIKGFPDTLAGLRSLIRKVASTYSLDLELPNFSKYAVISSRALLSWDKTKDFKAWKSRYGLQGVVNEYASAMKRGAGFPSTLFIWIKGTLYQIDGSKRLLAHLVAGHKEVPLLIIIPRKELAKYVDKVFLQKFQARRDAIKWFPNYQGVIEFGIQGHRNYDKRFGEVHDLTPVRGHSVVDFGCHSGQATVEAYFAGASRVVGFDLQRPCINVASAATERLGIPNTYHVADFNARGDFYNRTLSIIDSWDYALFLAVYRTKELVAREELFKFIVEHTRRGIFFEGHGAGIDTDAYYGPIFDEHKLLWKRTGRIDSRPAYFLEKATTDGI